jgi:hypothetical protein
VNLARFPAAILTAALMLVLAAASVASAKTADDYFHGAAHQYVAGKIQEASVEAEEGLRRHPGDQRLRMLAEQLRKMKDQQRGNSGQGQGKDDKDKKDQGNPGDKPDDGDKQDPDQKNQDGKDGDKSEDKPQPPQGGQDPKDKDTRDGQGSPPPGRMSEKEAKRLLNSFADDEKKEQAERRKVIRQRGGTEQDW